MSDDNLRSTHGPPPDPRRINFPPSWWSSLVRDDLPDDHGNPSARSQSNWLVNDELIESLRDIPGIREQVPSRWRAWLINAAVIMVAALLLTVGLGYTSPRGVAAVALIFGLPILLVVVAVNVVRRRHR